GRTRVNTSETPRSISASWGAFALFYVLMLALIASLDWVNGLLRPLYYLTQAGLLTVGVGIFALCGWRFPAMQAEHSALLAFTIGVLTIVPAVLMSLRLMAEGFWTQYFLIAFGMASGSLLGFLFTVLAKRHLTSRQKRRR
ncbi:MAG: hypothetical protein NZ765_11030, partial [Anaerolineae bacterium]|nr:hypothetical protein [Anaerolineae bacterium]